MKKITLFSVFLLMTSLIWAQQIKVPADQPSIQAAIIEADEGDTVLVEEGTYFENINFLGKAITVASHFILDKDTAHISKTIIDGSKPVHPDSASVVLMISGEDTTSVLSGLTITGGAGTINTFPFKNIVGAGIFMEFSGGKITHNIIEENHITDPKTREANAVGCGILQVGGNCITIIRSNIIRNNSVSGKGYAFGGAMVLSSMTGARIIIENNAVINNEYNTTLGGTGTGIAYIENEPAEEVIIRNNTISNNKAYSDKGTDCGAAGINIQNASGETNIQIYNNLISDNFADGFAGGINCYNSSGSLYNNTVVNNTAMYGAKNIDFTQIGEMAVYNNIIWSSGSDPKNDILIFYPQENTIYAYNNLLMKPFRNADKVNSFNNTYLEPLFDSDTTYTNAEGSPAVGRAMDSVLIVDTWHYASAYDMLGNSRPNTVDKYMDIGAYESMHLLSLLDEADLVEISFLNKGFDPGFNKDSLEYEILNLADTLKSSEALAAVTADIMADVDITYPDLTSENEEDWIAPIKVTSSDGSVEKIYSVFFNLLSTDATLSSLGVSAGTLSPEFDPEILSYIDSLPPGTTEVPEVSYETSHPDATVTFTPAGDLKSTAKILVKSEYGSPQYRKTYRISFEPTAVDPIKAKNSMLTLYPNPFTSLATLKISDQLKAEKIILLNVLGETVRTYDQLKGNSITIERGDLSTGLYFLQVQADDLYVIKVLIE